MVWDFVGKFGASAFVALLLLILAARSVLSKDHVSEQTLADTVRKEVADNLLGMIGGPGVTRAYAERRRGKQ
jgi:hypothetical protein